MEKTSHPGKSLEFSRWPFPFRAIVSPIGKGGGGGQEPGPTKSELEMLYVANAGRFRVVLDTFFRRCTLGVTVDIRERPLGDSPPRQAGEGPPRNPRRGRFCAGQPIARRKAARDGTTSSPAQSLAGGHIARPLCHVTATSRAVPLR